ncbi:HlyC/CorC family transporter [Candidatus Methylacidiphilum fumarolicum]|uniref:Hemolysin or related protein containing CBS domains n=3 Tax=Candidatus Methylacidiphilum fumarolicum TaxID=591154 RepID=I0JXU3_METFB|nr:hemolysin family protein [Candidatus Methylacidiphilum fumarolicum]MBW6414228.1 hemolysin family protein [Candidatus Methylacidiphilum fumarolicum]TFE69938.1 hemolysin activation protein [Candidatus Methylacidiphilum fumarolicum]TFE73742.1 HlyC/CorC family transporter [Candidatus Methylacidiphilum fumarolicum]TFE75652.1 HlyC/CorC family transporter [Candidatus Methylacidiphilum fumarolicum]TFE76815.1 hemolysin activation protein [Candidatus Methylacidiphilum fumarolicum]
MNNWFEMSWKPLLIVFLILANGFFVAAEFAIIKVRITELKLLLKTKDWRLPLALKIVQNPTLFLSATQIGITLSSLGLGWIAEPAMAGWIKALLFRLGISHDITLNSLSYLFALCLITFLSIALGELAPKFLALQYARKIILFTSPILTISSILFYPAISILNISANWALKLLGFEPPKTTGRFGQSISMDELQQIIMHSAHAHPFDELINRIMIKALRLKNTTAQQVMIPKDRVVVLWLNQPIQENLKIAQRSGYSRFPVCEGSIDNLVGMVLLQELLWQYITLGEQTKLSSILRPALIFSPSTPLPVMLEKFRKARTHLAIVKDKNEKVIGLVSFEDVLEELVGDIRDEFDIEKGPIYELTKEYAVVDGDLPLRDLANETNWPLPTDTTQTVSEWCFDKIKRQPKKAEMFSIDGFNIVVEEVSPQKIKRVKLIRIQEPTEEESFFEEGH